MKHKHLYLLLPFLLITNSFALFGPITTPSNGMDVFLYATSQLDIVFFLIGLTIATFIYSFVMSPLVIPLLILYLLYEITNAFIHIIKNEDNLTNHQVFNLKILGTLFLKIIGLTFFLWAIPVKILVLSTDVNNNQLTVEKLTDYFNKYKISKVQILQTNSTPKDLGFGKTSLLSLPEDVPIKTYFLNVPFASTLTNQGSYANLTNGSGPIYFELPAFIAIPLGIGESLLYGFYDNGTWKPGYIPSLFPGAFRLVISNAGEIIDAVFSDSASKIVNTQFNNFDALKKIFNNKLKLQAETNIALQSIITNYITLLYDFEAKAIVNYYILGNKGDYNGLRNGILKTTQTKCDDTNCQEFITLTAKKGTGLTAKDFMKKLINTVNDIQKINKEISDIINKYYTNLYKKYVTEDDIVEGNVFLKNIYDASENIRNKLKDETFRTIYKNSILGNPGIFVVNNDKKIYFPNITNVEEQLEASANFMKSFYNIYAKFSFPQLTFQDLDKLNNQSINNLSLIVTNDEHFLSKIDKTNRDANKIFNGLLTNLSISSGILKTDYIIPGKNENPDKYKQYTVLSKKDPNIFVIDTFYPDLNFISVHNKNGDLSTTNQFSFYDEFYNKGKFNPLLYVGYELDTVANLLLYDFYNQVSGGETKSYICDPAANKCKTFVPFKENDFDITKVPIDKNSMGNYYSKNLNAWLSYAFNDQLFFKPFDEPANEPLPYIGKSKIFKVPVISYNYYLLKVLNDEISHLFVTNVDAKNKTPEGNPYPFAKLLTFFLNTYKSDASKKVALTNALKTEMDQKVNNIYTLNKNIIHQLIFDDILPSKNNLAGYQSAIKTLFYNLVSYIESPISAQPITKEDIQKHNNALPDIVINDNLQKQKDSESNFLIKMLNWIVLKTAYILLYLVFWGAKIIASILFSLLYSLHTLGIILVFIFAPIIFIINAIFKNDWGYLFKIFKEYLAYRLIDFVLILEIYIIGIIGPIFMYMLDKSSLPEFIGMIFKILLLVFVFKLFSILIKLIFEQILGVNDLLGLSKMVDEAGNMLGKYSGGAAVQASLYGAAVQGTALMRSGRLAGAAGNGLTNFVKNSETGQKIGNKIGSWGIVQKSSQIASNIKNSKLAQGTGKIGKAVGSQIFDVATSAHDLVNNRNATLIDRLKKASGMEDSLGGLYNSSPRGMSKEDYMSKTIKETIEKKETIKKEINQIENQISNIRKEYKDQLTGTITVKGEQLIQDLEKKKNELLNKLEK